MLGLPKSTEVTRPFPKAQIYKKFGWKTKQRDSFDRDIAYLAFVNWISPHTLSAIPEGSEVKEIFIVEVSLKKRDFDIGNILLLSKSVPQRVIYVLHFGNEAMLAVYHTKLFTTSWQPFESYTVELSGLSLDSVWETIISSIGQFSIEKENTLTQQITIHEERTKLLRQIEKLEHQVNATKQPRRKRDLFIKLQKLKQQYNG